MELISHENHFILNSSTVSIFPLKWGFWSVPPQWFWLSWLYEKIKITQRQSFNIKCVFITKNSP